MTEFKIMTLILLALAIFDAIGDGFRRNGKQLPHHSFEASQVFIWLMVAFSCTEGWLVFEREHFIMYIVGRFQVFDYAYNLMTKNKLWYVGDSSLYGRFITFMTRKVFRLPLVHGVFMPKFMALVWWVAWFWTNGGY